MKNNSTSHFPLLLIGLLVVSLIVPCVAASAPSTGHPYMLFHDISETPGYQNRAMDPWKQWESDIKWLADNQGMTTNYATPGSILQYGSSASDLGMAYQITKDTKYATKAREALLNIQLATSSEKFQKAEGLGGYSLAYDFIQPTLDSATDKTIRDKLATLADSVYKDLTIDGSGYVSFADYHGRAYPNVGIAGAALYDYTNPNHLSLSSTPADWHKVGTEYLFENDNLHTFNRALFDFAFDEAGKYEAGSYKVYFLNDFATWFQVCYHTYGENLMEVYPVAKKAFTTEVWDSLPNQYSSNFVTNSNMNWIYHGGFVSLLPDTEKSTVLNNLDRAEDAKLLPYTVAAGASGGSQGISQMLLYSVFGNYASLPRAFPTTTSHLDPTSIFQVFRGNWNDDSDWLSLVTFNKQTNSNRDMAHHDQMSFEYYSRGDLLLADGGEDKYVLDKNYGMVETYHNTIAIEDPRTPFSLSSWAGSASRGMYKGYASGMVTPVTVDTTIQTPWFEALSTQAAITNVIGAGWDDTQRLSSPIQYERTVLYPASDYFIIVDRMAGTQPWVYRNIFRPTSLMITPTTDANQNGNYDAAEVGHVNGALTIGSTAYNWQALPYKTETNTGISTNALTWTTKNPYGKDVRLNLVSAPSSEILIEKQVGRIAGPTPASEVFSPIVWFRTPAATSQYRVSALLSSYSTETAKTATEITVTGTGHALKVHAPSYDDYVYTGSGTTTFDTLNTDADTAFIRKSGNITGYTLINGKHLYNGASKKFESSVLLDSISYNCKNTIVSVKASGSGASDVYFSGMSTPTYVKMDGAAFGGWSMSDSTTLKITKPSGTHLFEFNGGDGSSGGAPVTPVAAFTGTPLTGAAPLAVKFTDTSTGTGISAWKWDFNNDKVIDSTSQNPTYTYIAAGTYTVNLTVTGTGGSDSEVRSGYITVTAPSTAPVAAFSGTPASGTAPITVAFTDSSSGTSITNRRWDFGDGNISSYPAATNPSHRYSSAGSYTVNLTVTGTGGSDSEVRSGYITVTAPSTAPVAAFSGTPASGTAPITVAFTDSSSGTSITNRRWDFGDGNISSYSTATNPSHRYSSAGSYTVNLTVTGTWGSDSEVRSGYITVTGVGISSGSNAGVFRNRSGTWYLDTTLTGVVSKTFHFGTTGDIPVMGDWNNDGTTNAGVFRPSNGNWYLDTTKTGVVNRMFHFGKTGDIPVVGDWNNDGTTNAGVFRPSNGNWYLDTTKTGVVNRMFHFGKTGDIPVVGDWNNDGTTNAGVFRPSNGNWYLDTTKTGVVNRMFHFGKTGDIPVVGDWDGDGTFDAGIFRPSNGNWYLDTTKTGVVNRMFHFGKTGDIPVVGDWDGDGTFDAGIFRPSNGNWYLDTTKTGVVNQMFHFGTNGDTPVSGKG